MASLKYLTLCETVFDNMPEYQCLDDPEVRLELSSAIFHAYGPRLAEGENRESLRNAASTWLQERGWLPTVNEVTDDTPDIYALTFIWRAGAETVDVETHHVSASAASMDEVAEIIATSCRHNDEDRQNQTWTYSRAYVPMDQLAEDVVIRFFESAPDGLTLMGAARVSDVLRAAAKMGQAMPSVSQCTHSFS